MKTCAPPLRFVEMLQERYTEVLTFTLGETDNISFEQTIVYAGEFKAKGVDGKNQFFITSWDYVLPQSDDVARLDKALHVLEFLKHYSNIGDMAIPNFGTEELTSIGSAIEDILAYGEADKN